jgi:hypothetical protein
MIVWENEFLQSALNVQAMASLVGEGQFGHKLYSFDLWIVLE